MIVAVVGNPFDGMEIYGPFEHHEEATAWCERLGHEDWNMVKVQSTIDQPDYSPNKSTILDNILDLCQNNGIVDEALNELHCIEENGCRSSQM